MTFTSFLLERIHGVNRLVGLSISIACLVYATSCPAQMVVKVPGSDRRNIACLITDGITSINIRASKIEDKFLLRAICRGARKRQIHVLLDRVSPELEMLIGRKNVRVRIAASKQRGRFRKRRLSESFIMVIDKDAYQYWHGPLVWGKRAFGFGTNYYYESGYGPGETGPIDANTYNRDFTMASSLKRPQ